VFVFTSNDKGNIAEAEIAAAATRLGINVLKPLLEHGRYDLAFDLGDRILRVQCKWARRAGDVVIVHLVGFRYTATGKVRSKYSAEEIDAVAAYCDELDTCYLMPAEMIAGMSAVQLRLAAPKNGPTSLSKLGARSRTRWGYSSVGRAPPWHGGGRRFEPG
jgi:hypothetical protein